MESLYILIGICCGIFVLFSLSEVVTLKKEVKKLNGIVTHLLKQIAPQIITQIRFNYDSHK